MIVKISENIYIFYVEHQVKVSCFCLWRGKSIVSIYENYILVKTMEQQLHFAYIQS